MVPIRAKETVSAQVKIYTLEAHEIARKARPGQFVIVRVDEKSERIPLTIADFDRSRGTITLAVQEVGATTKLLGMRETGDTLAGVVGPLGTATHIERAGTVVCIGGGIGIACIHTIARGFHEAKNTVISIIGARNRDLLIFEKQMREASDELIVTTDDGSAGTHGFVTDRLQELLTAGRDIDLVFAVGPVPMMKAVAHVTEPLAVKTIVSLNPIMIDGTGMCGGCRVTVGGQVKFACVDGPDFDAHQVNFAELLNRQAAYKNEERCHLEYHLKEGNISPQ